jgi:flagellar basal-body rod protein FlgF
MSDIFQIASIGMFDSSRRLEAISHNAANAASPGYRSQVVSGSSFDALLAAGDLAGVSTLTPDTTGLQTGVNLQRGALSVTGRSLDVAIDADNAYFAVTDGAQTWLTRAGAFRIGQDGALLGAGGLHVVGTGGDIRLPSSDVTVEADGRITFQGTAVAALQLFRPSDGSSLIAAQGSLLTAPAGVQPAEGARVRGGTLEGSNTDSAHEMINLMTVARQFEALSHLTQGYDEVLGRTIERLGET